MYIINTEIWEAINNVVRRYEFLLLQLEEDRKTNPNLYPTKEEADEMREAALDVIKIFDHFETIQISKNVKQ